MNKIGIATKRWTMLRNVIQAPRMKECINYTKNFILEGFKADQSRKKKTNKLNAAYQKLSSWKRLCARVTGFMGYYHIEWHLCFSIQGGKEGGTELFLHR